MEGKRDGLYFFRYDEKVCNGYTSVDIGLGMRPEMTGKRQVFIFFQELLIYLIEKENGP
jgi:hypothetical protein